MDRDDVTCVVGVVVATMLTTVAIASLFFAFPAYFRYQARANALNP